MKETLIGILIVIAVIGWHLYLTADPAPVIVGTTQPDTVWRYDTLRPATPPPVILPGKVDSIPYVDWNAVDSIAALKSDSLELIRFLAAEFTATYEDSMQNSTMRIFPATKSLLFSPKYKTLLLPVMDVHTTAFVDAERKLSAFGGFDYRFSDSTSVSFYLELDFRIIKDFYITPRASTSEGISIGARYRLPIL